MTLFFVFIFVLVFAGTFHLHLLNNSDITLHISEQLSVEMPVILIVLSSIALGIALVLVINSIKGTSGVFTKARNYLTFKKGKKLEQLFIKGHRHLLSGEFAKAEEIVHKILQKEPDYAKAHQLMGRICEHSGDLQKAVESHSKAKYLDKNSHENLYALATAYEKSDRLDDALEILSEILLHNKEGRIPLALKRDILVKQGSIKNAIASQKKLLHTLKGDKREKRETDRLAWLTYLTGVEKTQSEEIHQSIEIFRGIIKSSPHFIPPYLKLGETLINLDKEKDATQLYKKGYETTKAFILFRKLLDLSRLSDDRKALFEVYEWGLSINPEAKYLNLLLGELYIRRGLPDKGILEIEKASHSKCSGLLTHLALGRALELAGREEESKREYHLAFKGGVNDLVVYLCSFCDNLEREWQDICPKCGEFNSFEADIS